MSAWFMFLAFAPLAGFVYYGFRAIGVSWKMIDQINSLMPLENHIHYYGLDSIMAWRRHEKLLPEQPNLRRLYKKLALLAVVYWLATVSAVLLLALVVKD
jgi:hypothetical protein